MNENVEKREEAKKEAKKDNGLIADLLNTSVKYFKWVVLAILLVIAFSGLRTVKEGEVAVVLRFGKLAGETRQEQVHEPGLMFAFPYIIDEVITVPTGKVHELTVDTHYTGEEMTSDIEKNGYCITGDSNVIQISTSVKYNITDPVAYALYTKDVDATLRGIVSNETLTYIASAEIDALLTDGKGDFSYAVLRGVQETLDRIGCGITLSGLEIVNVGPPAELKTMFDNVNSARVRQETVKSEAQQYADSTIAAANTEKAALISAATVRQNNAVTAAKNTLSQFEGLKDEYAVQPNVVILRVYHEKLTLIYQKAGKIVYVEDSENPNIVLP